jgi:hypothetical protein
MINWRKVKRFFTRHIVEADLKLIKPEFRHIYRPRVDGTTINMLSILYDAYINKHLRNT